MSESPVWKPNGDFFEGTHYVLSGPSDSTNILVCCHGIDSFLYSFDNLAAKLSAKNFKVLQYDLIGRGHSLPHNSNLYDLEAHLDQLRRLLEHLKLTTTPFHLLGLSMGGSLATCYASRHLDQIKTLTLLAPAGLMELPEVEALRNWPCLAFVVRYLPKPSKPSFYRTESEFAERLQIVTDLKALAAEHNPTHLEVLIYSSLPIMGPLLVAPGILAKRATVPSLRNRC